MNKNYNLKLDLQFRCNNSTMKFNQFDNNTSDFFMKISNGGKSFDIEKAIVVLAVIKPSGKVASQFVEVKNDIIYADLKASMKDETGTYTAKAMLILENERVVTDPISYEVEEDKIFSLLNDSAEDTEEFTLLTDMLNRLSTIETSEEQRMINEAERILSEENRKIEEAKRVEAELIRQHEEADRAKYDATRESNENIRKQNESIRLANETNRIDEESKRVEEENKRKLAEEERNANYNFMTEDEERRRSEANAHKEAEVLRVQAETDRVNEEAKRRTTEQARVSAENTRVSNENVREASEVTRKNNETQRVEAETQRQNRYNSFILDAEANANNFENYTNNAKVKEEERKANELDRKSQEVQRISNENERISNENSRKANEVVREENEISRQGIFEDKVDEVDKKIIEINATKDNFISSINTKVDTKISEIEVAKSDMTTTVSNKVNEVENRFNALTSKQQQDAEVIDARDGETSLKARLDRDIEKAKQVYVNVEGSRISTDSSSGYAKDVEILGNTVQNAEDLADIRSVGDKVEGQELYEIPVLSVGKNLFNGKLEIGMFNLTNGEKISSVENIRSVDYINIKNILNFTIKSQTTTSFRVYFYNDNKQFIKTVYTGDGKFINDVNAKYVNFICTSTDTNMQIQLEEGTVATPYEPYQEDKLTILSPVQLEKVGDVADRIIEKDGVWGVEKNVITKVFKDSKGMVKGELTNVFRYNIQLDDVKIGNLCISDKYSYINNYSLDEEHFYVGNDSKIYVFVNKTNSNGFPFIIKYATTQPTFIPLPHSQQVKLRTFANKTNISFGCEIEGTIKAQVPKSLGATVNTHTEQINNLNKELDRVKKLEESTVSTVTTESDFTTVEATSNGYFEDVKLEGKTLVNLLKQEGSWKLGKNTTCHCSYKLLKPLEVGKTYTYFYFNLPNTITQRYLGTSSGDIILVSWGAIQKAHSFIVNEKTATLTNVMPHFKTNGTDTLTTSEIENIKLVLLEGDHTQNPPSYFEGLKSVGDGADEIVVSSVNENLFDGKTVRGNLAGGTGQEIEHVGMVRSDFIPMNGNSLTIKNNSNGKVNVEKYALYDCNFNFLSAKEFNTSSDIIIPSNPNAKFVRLVFRDVQGKPNLVNQSDVKFCVSFSDNTNIEHQSDKKRLLYYNTETQTWEKPILREWDSIEKHADGKYYYHQRSGEVVLNGSENWSTVGTDDTKLSRQFILGDYPSDIAETKDQTTPQLISDTIPATSSDAIGSGTLVNEVFGIAVRIKGNKGVFIALPKTKLSTQNIAGFKQWLQANNVTVVYQLAQEKVYECTNIDLITYNGETNFMVESGVLSPRTTLKVHNNISNVVSLLQKKVSLLESNVKASQEVQDMMILETDMRMLDIELALMEFIPMKLNLGGSDMLRSATYFNFLKNHIINETYEKEYLENVMNKYLATGRINQDEYNELYKILYPPVYDIELPIEY